MTKPRCPNEAVPKIHARQCGQMVHWFYWSKDKGLPVKHMEDLVFVYGCTLVTSWAAAAFDDDAGEAQVSLACRPLNNGGSSFVWSNIRRTVEYHDSQLDPNGPYAPQNLCVFTKCLRAKRTIFWVKSFPVLGCFAEPDDDDIFNTGGSVIDIPQEDVINNDWGSVIDIPQEDVIDNIHESVINTPQEDVIDNDRGSIVQALDIPEYLDPLFAVLSYIEEVRPHIENDVIMLEHPHRKADEHEVSDKSPMTSSGTSTAINHGSDTSGLLSPPPAPRSMTGDTVHYSTVNRNIDASDTFDFSFRPSAQMRMSSVGPLPPMSHAGKSDRGNTGDQSTVKLNFDASDVSLRPGVNSVKRKAPMDVPPPQSDTKRLNRGDRGDQPTE